MVCRKNINFIGSNLGWTNTKLVSLLESLLLHLQKGDNMLLRRVNVNLLEKSENEILEVEQAPEEAYPA